MLSFNIFRRDIKIFGDERWQKHIPAWRECRTCSFPNEGFQSGTELILFAQSEMACTSKNSATFPDLQPPNTSTSDSQSNLTVSSFSKEWLLIPREATERLRYDCRDWGPTCDETELSFLWKKGVDELSLAELDQIAKTKSLLQSIVWQLFGTSIGKVSTYKASDDFHHAIHVKIFESSFKKPLLVGKKRAFWITESPTTQVSSRKKRNIRKRETKLV